MTTEQKIARLAALIEQHRTEYLNRRYPGLLDVVNDAKVTVRPGSKYVKVDVGTSGKYMVDAAGNIWGIKAYGVPHKGHGYGTLDTVDDYNWGGYVAAKKGEMKC